MGPSTFMVDEGLVFHQASWSMEGVGHQDSCLREGGLDSQES